ncbi:hypothetical protein [uncultured Gulosibacter sp.]|uniref:hypothetical protein n=1 Tax=uncultured Gulosibacter sp. TaxID=1339167 RepID=UPI00288BBF8B|nr:hypothetical protein [uncultured Gulosibacter sp.]
MSRYDGSIKHCDDRDHGVGERQDADWRKNIRRAGLARVKALKSLVTAATAAALVLAMPMAVLAEEADPVDEPTIA